MKIKTVLILVALSMTMTSCKTTEPTQPTKVSVVVVGMENSKWAGSCPGAHVDAYRMAEEFRRRYSDVVVLEDSKATKNAVKKALSSAANADLTILFYSGHGGSERFSDTGPEEIDNQDEYLCLYDTYMRDNEIWEFVTQCKGRVWLIFDCCHSETMFRSVGFRMKMMDDMVLPLSNTINMLCWSGCADNTFSYGDVSGGVFTSAIFRYLDSSLTYDKMWSLLTKDETLKSYEIIKRTKIGTGFDKKKVFE